MVNHIKVKMNTGSLGKIVKWAFDNEKIENITVFDQF